MNGFSAEEPASSGPEAPGLPLVLPDLLSLPRAGTESFHMGVY